MKKFGRYRFGYQARTLQKSYIVLSDKDVKLTLTFTQKHTLFCECRFSQGHFKFKYKPLHSTKAAISPIVYLSTYSQPVFHFPAKMFYYTQYTGLVVMSRRIGEEFKFRMIVV